MASTEAPQRNTVGFIGLGNMGGPMAGRLLAAGYPLIVNDIDDMATRRFRERGSAIAASPKEVADAAEIVFCSLPVPDVVRNVMIGERGVSHGSVARIVIDLSTTGPRVSQEIAETLARRGVTLVDAPVSGGVSGAMAGTLTIMVSGEAAALTRAEPLLHILGRTVLPVGDRAGQAQLVKLANNMLFASNLIGGLEVLAMGVKAGVDPERLMDAINRSSGRSFVTEQRIVPFVLDRDFTVRFAASLLHKDVKLGLDVADSAGAVMFIQRAAKQFLDLALAEGAGPDDYTALVRFFERWNGVEIRRETERKEP